MKTDFLRHRGAQLVPGAAPAHRALLASLLGHVATQLQCLLDWIPFIRLFLPGHSSQTIRRTGNNEKKSDFCQALMLAYYFLWFTSCYLWRLFTKIQSSFISPLSIVCSLLIELHITYTFSLLSDLPLRGIPSEIVLYHLMLLIFTWWVLPSIWCPPWYFNSNQETVASATCQMSSETVNFENHVV